MAVVERIAALYRLPLAEFTSARNVLARKLADEGDDAEARRVRGLKKPTADAWALNQLATRHREEIESLAKLTEDLADANDAGDARRLGQRRHELVAKLVRAAQKILRDAGFGSGPALEQRIAQSLYAATSGDDLATLRRGMWTRPLEGSGFTAGGFTFEPARASDVGPDPRAREVEDAKRRLSEAKKDAAALARRAVRARRAAEAAEEEAATAEREVTRLERRLQRLEKRTGSRRES